MNQEFDETKVSDTLNKNSENSVKWILIRDILFKDEKINITDKDTNNFIEDQLKKNINYKKEIKKYYLENDNKQKLKEDLLNQKLYSNLENYFINKIDENSTDKLKIKK
jgi:FKBP-type peptidyl-prolyl cis-trans isomerase (trigger factor)